MDDARIRQLADEVLSELRQPEPAPREVEARLGALEQAVARLQAGQAMKAVLPAPTAPAPHVHPHTHAHPHEAHPSLQMLGSKACVDNRCVFEPDKPCTNMGLCRTYGH